MKRVKPNITPTINSLGRKKEDFYHYNAADNREMLRRWKEYPLQDIVKKVPIQLDIETTSVCNLRCPMCWQSSPETRPVPQHMSYDLYTHIIDEFSEKGGIAVKLFHRGEPLVTKDISNWVRYASERGIQPCFNTNGVSLTQEKSRQLIGAELKQIIFSIDSHIPEEYERIRRPGPNQKGDFNRVLQNVRDLAEIRRRMGAKYPLIEVSRVDLPETKDSSPVFKEFWLKNGADYVSFVAPLDWTMGKTGKMLVSEQFACEMPWQRMFILADGLISPCCGDTYQQYPLAQIFTPLEIRDLEGRLETLAEGHNPEDLIDLTLISEEKLEKKVVGTVMKDGKVKATKVRVRGITGNISEIPIVDNVEAAWRGKRLEAMREVNRKGEAHKMVACADCGYRETTIRKANLPHTIESRNQKTKTRKTQYVEKGNI